VIHVENEAHSFIVLQSLVYRRLFAPKARVIVSVWANQDLIGFKGQLLDRLETLMRSRIDYFVAGNSAGRELLLNKGVPSKSISVVPHVGVDLQHYSPASPETRLRERSVLNIEPDEFVIGFVGRLVPEKGIADLLAAFDLYKQRVMGRKARLLFVGNGPLKADLSQRPDVFVSSPGGGGKVLPYYRCMNVLVLPSRSTPEWTEQFGIVLIEAMACGVPVIGSDSGAIPEVIGPAGIVFKEGDREELANELVSLAADEQKQAQLSELGRQRVTDLFSDEKIAERIFAVYRKVMNG
jgi:glycosyltransferase involved in cell wall biosynthesis